jgi:hypothetical protein
MRSRLIVFSLAGVMIFSFVMFLKEGISVRHELTLNRAKLVLERIGGEVDQKNETVEDRILSRDYSVVFTSRKGLGSLEAAAPDIESYREPVSIPWASVEGRLRVLDRNGTMTELTFGQRLPDGSTIIDVMSPSITIDGKSVLFAGRTTTLSRWRIYRVGIDGSKLEQVTGLTEDGGCVAIPPLRYRADGTMIGGVERRKIDYDDIDPTDLGPNGIAFASSRLPDLGRDHSRRSTQIWLWPIGANAPVALTANRNNDRWPVLINGEQILFSLWSRNREAVTADYADVRPVSEGGDFATRPTDNWMAAIVMTNAAQFGYAIKSSEPVWRPRPLFNGRVVYMSRFSETGKLRIVQADWGYIRTSPSSQIEMDEIPVEGGAGHFVGPKTDSNGRELIAATPSPAPANLVLFAGCPESNQPERFGIYVTGDDWEKQKATVHLLFDDPNYVDAEPVAAYHRRFVTEPREIGFVDAEGVKSPSKLLLSNGTEYVGPMGYLENIAMSTAIRNPIPWHDRSSGEMIDPRADPVISPPPNIVSVAVYSSGRDRFDDPEKMRIPGDWKKIMELPLAGKDDMSGWVPSEPGRVSVLVGLDSAGKVARWSTPANSSRPSRSYTAYAGDHYSNVRARSYNYCNGCHAGHTFSVVDSQERRKD